MKIIYLLDNFPNIPESFILNEILEVQKKGIVVEVIAYGKVDNGRIEPRVKEIKYLRYLPRKNIYNIIYPHLYFFLKKPLKYLKVFFFAINLNNGISRPFIFNLFDVILITKREPDHLHAHFGGGASNMAMLINLLTGISFTFTTHGYDIYFFPAKNYKIKSRLAKKHIAISEYNKQYIIRKFGVDEKNISVIHCGINFEQVFPKSEYGPENTIVSVARLDKKKGLDNLIKACKILKEQRVIFKCLIAGEGPERGNLEKLIKELGLINEVKLLGNLVQEEIFELLSRAKLKVLPSRSEGIPVSLMEAMAMKVPVIGPKVTGVYELVEDNICGFLVPPDDIEALVEKIKILLTDVELRKTFSENGYNKVFKDFNLKIETNKLVDIWKA